MNNGDLRAPITGKRTVPGLLFAGDLAISSFSIKRLLKAIDKVVKYCSDWNLSCDLKKSKMFVFKRRARLKKNLIRTKFDYSIEAVVEINYFGVTLATQEDGTNKSLH
jgi:hypothetical protein